MTIDITLTEDEVLGIEVARDRHNSRLPIHPDTGEKLSEDLTNEQFLEFVLAERVKSFDFSYRKTIGAQALTAALTLPKGSRDAIVKKIEQEVAKQA
jgi:hypothetical protein